MAKTTSRRKGYQAWQDRQAAFADFSLQALRSYDLDTILQHACILVARGLNVPIAKAMQAMPGGHELLLRAATGLPPDLAAPGVTRIPGDTGSAAGYALTVDEPVVSHIETETRFRISDIVRRSGVKVSVNVVIPTENGPFGTLEVDSLDERSFTPEDVDFLRIYAILLGAAVERQRAISTVRTLMRELQHRVKNDLQVITALVSLEVRQTDSFETRARLESVASRIESLRLVHDRLFQSERVGTVDLGDYLRELIIGRFRMHDLTPGERIRIDLKLDPVTTDHNHAVSVGLIVNEFLTNSLKYAFPMGTGLFSAFLDQPEPKVMRLILADNGIGIHAEQIEGTRGMGTRLIGMIAQQSGGSVEWVSEGGTRLTVRLPLH